MLRVNGDTGFGGGPECGEESFFVIRPIQGTQNTLSLCEAKLMLIAVSRRYVIVLSNYFVPVTYPACGGAFVTSRLLFVTLHSSDSEDKY
jgi:hypothetical protein